ncbi:putative O-glycosylation ligase, exosortase A system-associated [Massilia sp. R2A-15]|uniref:putative O-glycosylation ligase, exosortase A system-associated n=1 Tax=Massilia sp. R2A-15 TaxID=3064278 RepID=UPI0027342229|nr:putative O-glycosylation ligase, exosortase A system-associated [Massilia sp. R2A-15]WLI88933.1 putative O-glycosylation ligase, exosortase A system-associated [Massilia sp. R2A-15]
MRSAFLAAILFYVLLVGVSYPFVAMLAYVWIDIVKPQALAYSIINGLPLAMIAAIVVLISFLTSAEKKKIPVDNTIFLLTFFAAWITFTSAIADPGVGAWVKWDWAFKVVIFASFIPFVIRSRIHIEAFLLTMVFSIATISFSGGVKAALGGGGYGVLAIMGDSNSGLAESSTLAAVCVMQLPIMHYLYNHSVIFPNSRMFKLVIAMTALVDLFTIVGSGARTGLVAGGCLVALYALRSRHKVRVAIALAVALAIGSQLDLSGTAWGNRMSSIGTYEQDSSAMGRIEVWKWTMGFALQHPQGGGFDAFKLNRIASVGEGGVQYYDPNEYRGKAFHNVFFEVMGEQGLIGFAVYLSILGMTFWKLSQVRRRVVADPEKKWMFDMASRLSDALTVLLVGGMFIGIAYQCYIFYLVSLAICLNQMTRAAPAPTWVAFSHAKER